MKWKDRLLSSSLPLEYEVGKILAENNFFVDFDYSYKRLDASLEKEFSIDVKAGGFYPFEMDASIEMRMDLLLECKYRNPNTSWLFIKDVNIPEYARFSIKGPIKVIDEFSEVFSGARTYWEDCAICLKGMEVNTSNGEVHDTGISHGISQLVYSMPPLLGRHIRDTLSEHPNDVYPYLICPILLTTADLRVLDGDFSVEKLQKTESLDDISREVPYLIMYAGIYPSFEEHCRNTFKDLPYDFQQERFDNLCRLRNAPLNEKGFRDGDRLYSDPGMFLSALQHGFENDIFKEVLVCNLKNFRKLLSEIKSGIEIIGKGLEKINGQD